jgi:hypothetical protein
LEVAFMGYEPPEKTDWVSYARKIMAEPDSLTTHKLCPFCGGQVDPEGWMSNGGATGPECEDCGATTPTIERWDAPRAPRAEGDYRADDGVTTE